MLCTWRASERVRACVWQRAQIYSHLGRSVIVARPPVLIHMQNSLKNCRHQNRKRRRNSMTGNYGNEICQRRGTAGNNAKFTNQEVFTAKTPSRRPKRIMDKGLAVLDRWVWPPGAKSSMRMQQHSGRLAASTACFIHVCREDGRRPGRLLAYPLVARVDWAMMLAEVPPQKEKRLKVLQSLPVAA